MLLIFKNATPSSQPPLMAYAKHMYTSGEIFLKWNYAFTAMQHSQ